MSPAAHTQIGQHIHRLIALQAAGQVSTANAGAQELVGRSPVRGKVHGSARVQIASAATVYRLRFQPDAELVAVELPVGRARADLVWRTPEGIVIDEVKSGPVTAESPALRDQLGRLVAGGHKRWGDGFRGVRLVPLARPSACRFAVPAPSGWAFAPLPDGLAVRP